MTISFKTFNILNSKYFYTLCLSVLISYSNTISEYIFLIVLKSQLRTCLQFIKYLIESLYFCINNSESIISFSI